MLKNLIILILFSFNTFAQINYEIHYNLTHQIDSNDINTRKTDRMVLDIGNDYSVFHSYKTSRRDSIDQVIKKMIYSEKTVDVNYLRNLRTSFNFRIFYEYKTNSTYQEEKIINDIYCFYPKFNGDAWTIHNEKKKINGYLAQKATITYAGRNYEAWFTSEIPIIDGPYVFKGLPGFILKVNDIQNYYIFEYIGMHTKPKNRVLAQKDNKAQKVEFEKGLHIKKLYREDPANISKNVADFTSNMTNYKQNQRSKAAKLNNPLEKNQ